MSDIIEGTEQYAQSHKAKKVDRRMVNGREMPPKRKEELPTPPVEYPCDTLEEVRDKVKNRLLKDVYLDIEKALYGILNFDEFKIAKEGGLMEDEELIFLIEKRKAQKTNEVVSRSVRDGKTAESFKLLASSDKDRAKLNTRTEVKEDKKGKQIKIIHN